MKRFSRLLAVGSAALAFAGVANAQYGSPQPGTGTLFANLGANDPPLYDFHWHSPAGSPSVLFGGPFMWTFFNNGQPNIGGPGDAIRLCYSLDVAQGGRNWSGSPAVPGQTTPGPFSGGLPVPGGTNSENTWFRWTQGFAPGNAGVGIGLISVQAGTTSARGGDNCFTPFFKGFSHTGDSGGHKLAAAAVGGTFAATSVAPFPIFWEFTFAWGPTPALVPNVIGDDSLDPGIPLLPMGVGVKLNMTGIPAPLLANVIYEVQAPVNAGINNTQIQYYLGSTVEFTGINAIAVPMSALGYIGTGGTSNGNGNMGLDLFGIGNNAGATNAVAASRVLTAAPGGGFVNEMPGFVLPVNQPGPPFSNFRNGRFEFTGQIAFAAPKLWSYHNFQANPLGMPVFFSALGPGHTPPPPFAAPPHPLREGLDGNNGFLLFTGSGGPDWRVTGAPLSRVDVIAIDHDTGAETAFNVYAKVGNYLTTTPSSILFTPNGPYAHAAAAFDTSLGVGGITTLGIGFPLSCKFISLAIFNWTLFAPAVGGHPQYPGSWGFKTSPPVGFTQGQPTSVFGLAVTGKEGVQTLPLGFITGDPIFGAFLSSAFLTFSSNFGPSDDFFADGALDYGGNIFPSMASIFQGLWAPETSGQADLKPGGGQAFVGFPDPSLAGLGFNVAGQSICLEICTAGIGSPVLLINEVFNALVISIQ